MQQVRDSTFEDRLAAVLLGTSVGDSVGLPAEGLSARRRLRLLPGPWRHRFLCGCGMISDDTEHTLTVAQSLLTHPDDATAFGRDLAASAVAVPGVPGRRRLGHSSRLPQALAAIRRPDLSWRGKRPVD